MAIAIAKARRTGVGMVTVQRAGHLGMCQYHAMLALPHDMIGVALSASEPLMVPTFGRDPRLGTNPIAVAAPCAEEPPFVYDAATTAVAGNKIYAAWLRGAVVPGGLLADADGAPMLAP
jgi:LDH2 family malate/lactate/ureidoglycolate dehydrogenase